MSKNIPQDQMLSPAKETHNEPSYEEQMAWRARWFLIRVTPVIYIVSLASSITCYWITKDWHYLLLASPTLLTPTIGRLLPLDERRYNLEMAKIDADKRIKVLEERVQKLEKELNNQHVISVKFQKSPVRRLNEVWYL
jgi:hypothetical protein